MKSNEQLIKLAQNPYYTLSEAEEQQLAGIEPDEVAVDSSTEDSKKKPRTSDNAIVKETGRLSKHATGPVSE